MRITVFTPTYNRAYIIENLYRSLQAQSFNDFEWLVIDDGSTDNTKELFEKWKKDDNLFVVRYYRFENAGKQREINRALKLAKGELFFTVDSDDTLKDNALELIDGWEEAMPKNVKYCGLAGNSEYTDKHFENPTFDRPYLDTTFFARIPEMCKNNVHIGYDRPWVFYTEVHRKYFYPEFENEKFITEAVTWNRMAHDGYKIRCFNEIIYTYNHQDEGYTNSIMKILVSNPKGYGLCKQELMLFLNYNFKKRFQLYYSFYCDLTKEYNWKEIAGFIKCPACMMFFIDKVYRLKHRRKV